MPRSTAALPAAIAIILGSCGDNFAEDLKAVQDAPFLSTGATTGMLTTGPESGPDATGASATNTSATGASATGTSTTGASTTGDAEGTTTGPPGASTMADDGATADTGENSGGVLPPPRILSVDMPGEVGLAGPVPFTATTEHAISARATLDGVDLGALHDDGGGMFSGVVAIHGAVDNGDHVLDVIAERDGLSDHISVPFVVSTPAPGTPAWAMPGPTGTRTRRIALTAAGDVLEVGTLVVAGVQRPVLRKRSGLTGVELFAGGTLMLDEREGWGVDVAVTPDGQLWVAMMVREAANKWRPRVVLLDAAGQPTGVEIPTEAGQTITGVDNDGTGGCVAVGFVGTGLGDSDVVIWRMNGNHVPVLGGKSWDYQPPGKTPHIYTDLATDVVVNDGIVWIVGMSIGPHSDIDKVFSRGLVLRMDIATTAVLGPVIIAPASGPWTQSKFFGAAAHPDGILVTGNGCNNNCDSQRVETALYTAAGARPWFRPELAAAVAFGSAVAVNAHGGVAVAATMREGTALRGYLLGRVTHEQATPFNVPFPASKEDSEASDVAVDAFDRMFVAGYRTFGGVTEARLVLVHP